MTAPKRTTSDHDASSLGRSQASSGGSRDSSLDPTRKVESMSSLVADLLVQQHDADATSPAGLTALTGVKVTPSADTGAHADAAAIEMARLIEVESEIRPASAAPTRSAPPPAFRSVPPAFTPTEEIAYVRILMGRRRRNILLVVGVLSLALIAALASFMLVR